MIVTIMVFVILIWITLFAIFGVLSDIRKGIATLCDAKVAEMDLFSGKKDNEH